MRVCVPKEYDNINAGMIASNTNTAMVTGNIIIVMIADNINISIVKTNTTARMVTGNTIAIMVLI